MISDFVLAFLKRRSQVRLLPGAQVFSKDLSDPARASGAENTPRKQVRRTKTVHGSFPYGARSSGLVGALAFAVAREA